MKAAKDFVEALISENIAELNQVVYPSQSMPLDKIMTIAKVRKINQMKPENFTYKTDSKDNATIFVSFKDEHGVRCGNWLS